MYACLKNIKNLKVNQENWFKKLTPTHKQLKIYADLSNLKDNQENWFQKLKHAYMPTHKQLKIYTDPSNLKDDQEHWFQNLTYITTHTNNWRYT